MKTVKEQEGNESKTTILKLWNLDYKRKIKPKLKNEEQRSKRRRSCSLDFGPKNMHQSKLKHKRLKWYTWENLKPPKDA
jgi:hypothetical protein